MTPAIDNPRPPLASTLASTRRWRSRARLALAVIASLALHWLLQQGLTRTVIAVRPLDGLLAEREPSYRPELASDFPLHDVTATREAFAHERPLDIPIAIDAAAPASARGPLREGERAVAEGAVAEEAEAPDVAATRIDRPVFEPPVPGPEAFGDLERIGAEMAEGSAAAETLRAVVGSDAAEAPAAARRERSSTSDEPAVDPASSRGRAVIDPPETGPAEEPVAVISPRRFARAGPGADAPPALPRSLRRTDVAEPGAGGETARVELPARGAAGMAGGERDSSAVPQPGGAGADLPAGPRPRGGRIPDRGRGSGAVARRGGAATGAEEEMLSAAVTAPTASESAVRPRTKPLAGTTDVAGPAAVATPMRRARTLLLPAETRVRETAGAFARRWRENRGESPADALVERGLDWLVAAQEEDGRWTLGAYHPDGAGGAVRLRSDTAATGLALLAFLGAGYDHFDGRHRDVVRRGLEWLVSVQQGNGDLFVPSDPVSNSCAWLYSHGIATMALCEAVGMTGDPLLRPAAERAIGFIVASQQPGRGGWRYQPRADSDLSVSGWMLVALRAGTLAGLSVPAETYAGVRGLLDESASPDRAGHYLYNARNPGQRPSDLSAASMTALGSLMRLHTGTPRTDERLRTAAGDLAAMTPAYGTRQARSRDAYLWYYSSQVLVQTGGPQWDAWYGRLCTVLEAEQVGDGDDAGSWEPLGTVPDRWGAYGGRLYVTALHLLALEVPYR
ncbi:MAG: hypothetical protein EXS06_07820, partial [Planctomycetaceae bacterium]|nr:hypothetical protein [Planctomycetaceae bacterium]